MYYIRVNRQSVTLEFDVRVRRLSPSSKPTVERSGRVHRSPPVTADADAQQGGETAPVIVLLSLWAGHLQHCQSTGGSVTRRIYACGDYGQVTEL